MAVTNTREVSGGMNLERNLFHWTIDNFDVLRESEKLIEAQKFSFKAGKSIGLETEWTLRLKSTQRRKVDDEEEKMWVGCFLKLERIPEDAEQVFMTWKLKVKKSKRHHFFKRRFVMRDYKLDMTHKHDCGRGWGYIVPQHADLTELPVIDGSLVLEVEIELYAPKPTLHFAIATEECFKPRFAERLVQDLSKMFAASIPTSNAETKIISENNVEFSVNRGVLCARSPVFEKMFGTAMSERETGVVRITDISARSMHVLLQYIYTGTLDSDWRCPDVLPELVYAADKYQLAELLEFLDQVAGAVCTKENAGKLINLATKLTMKKAERDLFQFLRRNISSAGEMMDLFTVTNVGDI